MSLMLKNIKNLNKIVKKVNGKARLTLGNV